MHRKAMVIKEKVKSALKIEICYINNKNKLKKALLKIRKKDKFC